jgi:hypothetical protein
MQAPEAFGASEQDAGLDTVAAVDVQELVSQQTVSGSVAFTEVRGELQTVVVVHS